LEAVGEVAALVFVFEEGQILASFERAEHFVSTDYLHVADSFFAGQEV